ASQERTMRILRGKSRLKAGSSCGILALTPAARHQAARAFSSSSETMATWRSLERLALRRGKSAKAASRRSARASARLRPLRP
ncbi:MAG: hypothetical protein IJH68_00220, partial [Thermoguttaceae bacterium]|nr:hypothetical protein [Thermoguttaceae bacterium]